MIDAQLLGQEAAKAMQYLDENEDMDGGELVAVQISVIVSNGDMAFTRVFSSEKFYHQQVGHAEATLNCIKDGFRFHNPSEAIDDEDDDDE